MTAIVITASLDRAWVKPLSTLRSRGVACVVVSLDIPAFERREQELATAQRAAGLTSALAALSPVKGVPEPAAPAESAPSSQQWRALRHALAEYDIAVFPVGPTTPLAKALAS